MKPKVLTETNRAINARFFQALKTLKDERKIKSLESFCKENGLSRPKYAEFMKEYIQGADESHTSRYKILDFDAVHALVANYDISAEWLITGGGSMFKTKRK